MSFYQVFDFLRDLQNNNSKEWMDDHRDRYEASRDYIIHWTNSLMEDLKKVDTDFEAIEGKKAISRINNNRLFHPDKPIYKDHFGVGFSLSEGPSGFYVHMGLSDSFIGGGLHNPEKDQLKKIRKEIDYNGKELESIVTSNQFIEAFGELSQEDKLKTAPKGYDQDHEHIELLRLNRFAAMVPSTQKEISSDDFKDQVVNLYKTLMPLGKFLNMAVSD